MGIVLVCEGKADLTKLKQINKDYLVITTGGFSFNDKLLDTLKELEKTNQIVLLLDPDYAGETIRKRLHKALNNPLDIFMEQAKCQGIGKVGIEHAKLEDIKEALKNVIDLNKQSTKKITEYDLYTLGLNGVSNANILRDKIATKYHFYQVGAKDFLRKINHLNITLEELKKEVKNV